MGAVGRGIGSWSHPNCFVGVGMAIGRILFVLSGDVAFYRAMLTQVLRSFGNYVSAERTALFSSDLARSAPILYCCSCRPLCSEIQNLGDLANAAMSNWLIGVCFDNHPLSRSFWGSSNHLGALHWSRNVSPRQQWVDSLSRDISTCHSPG